MSDKQDEIRARYEAAIKARQFKLSFDTVGASSRDVDFALADIPRLQQEVERLNVEEQLYRLSYQGLLLELNKALELENQLPSELLKHIATLRAQLVGRDAEVERLEGILQSATETFTAAQLGKESQIESLSTENKRLREALTELQVVAQESYERTSTNCRKRRERLSSALRRAGEAMEEKDSERDRDSRVEGC